jgi:hypothetical protein
VSPATPIKPSSRSTALSRVAGLPAPREARLGDSVGSLLERLAQGLEQKAIAYCQWKGHWSAHRWSTGQGTVDLLVDFSCRQAFRQLADELGFKLGYAPGASRIPGVDHYLGFDPAVSRLLHLQVHYRLLLGDYWKPVYRVPIEASLLKSAVPGSMFRVPAPTHQYLVFVLRMMLRQVGRPLLSAQTLWTTGIRMQLESLQACSSREELGSLLRDHLSPVDLQIFDRCVRSLQGGCEPLERAVLPWELHRRLRAHLRLPSPGAVLTAALERVLPLPLPEKICDRRLCLSDSGLVLALIGHGPETPTAAREVNGWLGAAFRTRRADLGNPPRSWLTLAVDALLEVTHRFDRMRQRSHRSGTTIELLRHLCTARDRYDLYVRVRRFAVNGGIGICEGHPMAQEQLVAPRIRELLPAEASRMARLLGRLEATYYERMLRPDLVVALEPNLQVSGAQQREDGSSRAPLVDASQPMPDLIRSLQAVIWSHL